jgi:hypothetical protein
MYRLLFLGLFLLFVGCNTTPEIIPDPPPDSPVVMKLKNDIVTGNATTFWGWILWYVPVLLLVVAWAYREFFYKPKKNGINHDKQDTQVVE